MLYSSHLPKFRLKGYGEYKPIVVQGLWYVRNMENTNPLLFRAPGRFLSPIILTVIHACIFISKMNYFIFSCGHRGG
jgi:hypothetical protein